MGEVRPDQTRINFHVDKDLNRRLDARVPWGMKAQLLRVVFGMVADALDKYGDPVLGVLLSGGMELKIKKKKGKAKDVPTG